MQKINCSQCGVEVRVAGIGAICPNCGALVVVGGASAPRPTPVEPIEEDPAILNLLEAAPPPEPTPVAHAPEWQMFERQKASESTRVYWVVGILAFLVVGLVVTLLVLLSIKPRTITVTVPAPTPPPAPVRQQSTAPTPRGSDWFVSPDANTARGPSTRPVARAASETPAPTPPRQAAASPPPAPATRPATRPAGPHAALALLKPRPPAADRRPVTDDQINSAIRRGSAFLLSQFAQTRLKNADSVDPETFAGLNALATYALLQCGKSLGDPRLSPQSELVRSLLDRLKEYPMRGNRATYSRSLRISALTVHTRAEDRAAIQEDLQWLLRSSVSGAYSYDMPPPGRLREHNVWDNSNSQYGALGVWAAAEAGFPVPATYWQSVEQHWMACQLISGAWSYNTAPGPTLSMTAAGTNMLFVARDQLAGNSVGSTGLSQNLQRAMEWLDEGENALHYDVNRRGYSLYSVERAGLASGFRYLGSQDWYLSFAKLLVASQAADGSWSSADGNVVETSFDLLFLLRGREPALYAKLKFDGAWNNRPRDVSVLTRFSSHQLERSHNWYTADVQRNWWEWLDAPVLLITSDRGFTFPDSAVDRLRAYAQNGGLIFLHTERDNAEFKASARDLCAKLFPNLPLAPLPGDHPIYSAVIPLDQRPALEGAGNGVRLLVLYSAGDLTRTWQVRPGRTQKLSSELGMNIGVYGAGRRNLGSRFDSPYIPEPTDQPLGKVPLARISYAGNWDPEPAAWPRLGRLLQSNTGIAIDLRPTDVVSLKLRDTPIAHLTGTDAVSFTDREYTNLRAYVNGGGILLIEACGGNKAFVDSLQPILGGLGVSAITYPLPSDHPIQTGNIPGAAPLPRLRVRDNLPSDDAAPRFARLGAGFIIYTPQDLSAGLVGANTLGIRGYQPDYCQQFALNLMLWVTQHSALVPPLQE